MHTLRLHYVPTCAFSAGMVSFLVLRGADFEAINLDEHGDERSRLEQAIGDRKLETPTLEADGELFVAPTMSRVKDLLEEWNLPKDAAPHHELKDLRESP